jgi:high-affinity iron transporter
MTVQVFAIPVFFVVFRECLETAVIVSVLLAFLKQTLDGPNRDMVVYKKLVKQVSLRPMPASCPSPLTLL